MLLHLVNYNKKTIYAEVILLPFISLMAFAMCGVASKAKIAKKSLVLRLCSILLEEEWFFLLTEHL